MKSYLLAFDCSFNQAGLALLDLEQLCFVKQEIKSSPATALKSKQIKDKLKKVSSLTKQQFEGLGNSIKTNPGLIEKIWDSSSSPHSDQLPLKIQEALEEIKLLPKNTLPKKNKPDDSRLTESLIALSVGAGPGRFTGIRTALSVAKSLSYSLQIPICPVNSLQLIAESFFEQRFSQISQSCSKIYVSLQAFKKQVYHGEFYPSGLKPSPESIKLLDFKNWEEKIIFSREETLICLSDLEAFYEIKPQILKKLKIQKPKISPWVLIKLALEQGNWEKDWKKIQPNYMRANV